MNAPFVRRARLVAAEAEAARVRAELDTAREVSAQALYAAQGWQKLWQQATFTMLMRPYVAASQETGHEQPQSPAPE